MKAPVYVTSHGRRYHDPMRHRMTGSSRAITTHREAERKGYVPCAFCFGTPPTRPALGRNPSRAFLELKR